MLLALRLQQNQKYGFLLQFITAVGLAIKKTTTLWITAKERASTIIGLQRSAQNDQNMTFGQRHWEPPSKF